MHVGNDGAIYMGACGAILSGPIAGHDEKVSELTVHCCLLLMGPQTAQSLPRKRLQWHGSIKTGL